MNYQKQLEIIIKTLPDYEQTLLLHSCCAPCSSYVLEYLRLYFKITVLYYNPNITNEEEYEKRIAEQKRLIEEMNRARKPNENEIFFLAGEYEPERFLAAAAGLFDCKEGGLRCERCFWMRLEKTALEAKQRKFSYFTTTLTISPLKNAELLNEIGKQLETQMQTKFLPSDFKKKNGYKRSVALSAEHELYRQDYCGCVFSKQQRELEKKAGGRE